METGTAAGNIYPCPFARNGISACYSYSLIYCIGIWDIFCKCKVTKPDQQVIEIEKNYLDRFEDLKTTLEVRLHPIRENIAMLVERTRRI